MVALLRSVGSSNFQVVGSLALANRFQNPSFESASGGIVNAWSPIGAATFSQQTAIVRCGSAAGKFTFASASGVQKHGATQLLVDPLNAESNYNVNCYINMPTATVPLKIQVSYLDPVSNPVGSDQGVLLTGAATNGWVRPSYVFTMPDGATNAQVSIYVEVDTSVTSVPAIYLDGAMVSEGSTLKNYVDGDMPGYVWSGGPGSYSTTLTSTVPRALAVSVDPVGFVPLFS